jgi:hypothetical protein
MVQISSHTNSAQQLLHKDFNDQIDCQYILPAEEDSDWERSSLGAAARSPQSSQAFASAAGIAFVRLYSATKEAGSNGVLALESLVLGSLFTSLASHWLPGCQNRKMRHLNNTDAECSRMALPVPEPEDDSKSQRCLVSLGSESPFIYSARCSATHLTVDLSYGETRT